MSLERAKTKMIPIELNKVLTLYIDTIEKDGIKAGDKIIEKYMKTFPYIWKCDSCIKKPGSPPLCRECLERRELWRLAYNIRNDKNFKASDAEICAICQGTPKAGCKEHGR